MPSQPIDIGWDFSPVIDLIDLDVHGANSPSPGPSAARLLTSALQEDGGIRLGSFAKLYQDLGFPSISPIELPIELESECTSDDALPTSPLHKESDTTTDSTKIFKEIQSGIDVGQDGEPLSVSIINTDVNASTDCVNSQDKPLDTTGLSKSQRKKARRKAEKELREKEQDISVTEINIKQDTTVEETAHISSKAVETPTKKPQVQSCSNMALKKQPLSSFFTAEEPPTLLPEMPQEVPKTPKLSRSFLGKRLSTTRRASHRRNQSTNNVPTTQVSVAPQPIEGPSLLPSATQHPVYGLSTPFQYPLALPHISGLLPSQIYAPPGYYGPIPSLAGNQMVSQLAAHAVAELPTSIPAPLKSPAPVQLTPGIQPIIRSQLDRHFNLFNKLLRYFPDDQKWLVSPKQLVSENTANHGIHIFVDASNILYGFRDALRRLGTPQYELSFDSLALLMERRRPVAKRVYAGSHREAHPVAHVTKMVEMSKAVGYESNVKEQVLIVREVSEKKKFFNDVKKLGWHKAQQLRSGSSSDSETGMAAAPKTPSTPKWVEQGVDEILHLKMCQSIIDTEVPGIMVLATGDGAEAEMSDGFLAHVERALKKKWKVELISWKQQTNAGYRKRQFRAKWAEQFTIIELDDFLEDIIDTP